MKIICLGWGSLIWDPRELKIKAEGWHNDGPLLPIEFTRKSSKERITLIIDEESKPLNVLWAELEEVDLDKAIETLRVREGKTPIENIKSIKKGDVDNDPIKSIIIKWLEDKDADAVIWTGLTYLNNKRPTLEEVINYLSELINENKQKNSEEYIRKAPKQIDTYYRKEIEKRFGWTSIE